VALMTKSQLQRRNKVGRTSKAVPLQYPGYIQV
jgi:hypothetical protein